jgi:ribose 5-phosphate isomerase A
VRNQAAGLEYFKRQAAERALSLVRPGMMLGLGSGSTATYFIEGLGRLAQGGLQVTAVATSKASEQLAREAGIRVLEGAERPFDLAVDGADQVDPRRNCVKGRGGALLREKIVAFASRRFVVIADETKAVQQLHGPVPVEVLPFLWRQTAGHLEQLGGRPQLRGGMENPYVTDNGNLIVDVDFGPLPDPVAKAAAIRAIPGVLAEGLFTGVVEAVIFAGPNGVRISGNL